ncbi:Auxin response factor domain-containing protein [Dioscorea alata]|uniref:Auxin response factor domain-containing protein n=1 Tax=Dioscorea alata TaxID=55571 RepID=A0ACB7W0G9_DIOAL|nr:Auxin response factor domain-containing protein [Dioscorea alata]
MDGFGRLDRSIWLAFAGITNKIPAVGSKVYYFPEGHAEQSFPPMKTAEIPVRKTRIRALLSDVSFHADPESDEVFARMTLDPRVPVCGLLDRERRKKEEEELQDYGGVVSHSKVLTLSDSNNGGGFSVPKDCATFVFPQLDLKEDMPVQSVTVRDLQGNVLNFRHVFRGSPRRHLLTTNWSKFVNSKNIIAGDKIIFARDRSGDLYVGFRRSVKPMAIASEALVRTNRGFWRYGKGRVPIESVKKAMNLAEMGLPFEVVYYPRAGLQNFVVEVEAVDKALMVGWAPGMKVKAGVEIEDGSLDWYKGTVLELNQPESSLWQSPWRKIKIEWEEPGKEKLKHLENASPWQVVLVMDTPQQPHHNPPRRMLRNANNSELSYNNEDISSFQARVRSLIPSREITGAIPAGMQGARHDPPNAHYSPNSSPNNPYPMWIDNLDETNTQLKLTGFTNNVALVTSPTPTGVINNQGRNHFISPVPEASRQSNNKLRLFGRDIVVNTPVNSDAQTEQKDAGDDSSEK